MITVRTFSRIAKRWFAVAGISLLLPLNRASLSNNTPALTGQSFTSVSFSPRLPAAATGVMDTTELKQSEWYRHVTGAISESEYEVRWQEQANSYQAPNREHDIRSSFYADKLVMESRDAKDDWQLQLRLKNITSDNSIVCQPVADPSVELSGEQIVFNHNEQFKVEYINNAAGIRENFIIEQAPASPAEQLDVHILVNEGWNINQPDEKELHFAKRSDNGTLQKITYNSLKAWDATRRELPAQFIVHNDTLFDIVVNTRNAVYPVTIDPLSSTAAWTAECNQAHASFGTSVASAGDINGDGYSDVIVGAFNYDNGQADEGRVYAYYGSSTGLSATAGWITESNHANAGFAYSISTAGDVNRDGFSDIIVGAYSYDNGQTMEGKAFVYHGSATGLSANPDWTAESNKVRAIFGFSVATAGDVNGDGYSDVIIGAYEYDDVANNAGKVFVYYGTATGLAPSPAWTAQNDVADSWFGYSVSPAGDINGDGYSDVIVGAPLYKNVETDEGKVYVYHGSATGLSAAANWSFESNEFDGRFGACVSAAGDVNGDGYGDIIVGAYGYSYVETGEGMAFVFHGSAAGLPAAANWSVNGVQLNATLGSYVACAGDVNGDGFSDVVVAASLYDNGQTNEGKIFVYNGSAAGLSATANWTAEGNQSQARFGVCVAPAGDVNGDGFSDLIVGANMYDNGQTNEGAAFLYLGSGGGLAAAAAWTAEGNQANSNYGFSLAPAGDINGDGYYDIIVGAGMFDGGLSDEGKAFVYLGSTTGLSASPAWTATGNQANAWFGRTVASAGDVNGDGFSDVMVGAPRFSNGEPNEGVVFIYHGSATGLSATANQLTQADQSNALYGSFMASAGDVNRDGYGDIIVAAVQFANGQVNEGKAFLYYGSAAGVGATPVWTAEGDQADASFGSSLSYAGDINGDGYGDIIVGAFTYSNGQVNEGKAFVYYGSVAGLDAAPGWTTESNQDNALLGNSVSSAGDVNGDGFSDIIIGVYRYSNDQVNEGRVLVYYGSAAGLPAAASWTAESNQANSTFGISVASAGDVNGDGYSDIVIGARTYSNGEANEGRIFVYHGSSTGLQASPGWTAEINQVNANFGTCVAGAGDVNGDGYGDIIAGAHAFSNGETNEGGAFMYYGNENNNLHNNLRLYNTDLVTPLNKSNMQFNMFGLGLYARSPIGRTKGKLVWETAKEGTAFSNSPITNSTLSSGSQPGFSDLGVTGNELKASALKVGAETKIRARVQYDKATAITGQVYGPWRYISGYQQGVHLMGFVALPFRLVHFSGDVPADDHAVLHWTTANETGMKHFELQRSSNGIQFNNVATIQAKQNTDLTTYNFRDAVVLSGKAFYRLKMVALNGAVTYSPVILLENGAGENWTVYPNPVRADQPLYLHINSNERKNVKAEVLDMQGRIVLSEKITLVKGSQVVTIGSLKAGKGIYVLRVTGFAAQIESKKIMALGD